MCAISDLLFNDTEYNFVNKVFSLGNVLRA